MATTVYRSICAFVLLGTYLSVLLCYLGNAVSFLEVHTMQCIRKDVLKEDMF